VPKHSPGGVKTWVNDPKRPGRQLGWVELDSQEYVLPVRRLAIRFFKKRGVLQHALLISTLEPREVITLLGLPVHLAHDPQAVILAYATLYDQRGGTVEVEIKESKQGIGINKRSKHRFAAQQMVMLLGSLAHNLIVWSRRWLAAEVPRLARYGALRMVRDLFQVAGLLGFDPVGRLTHSTLNRAAPFAAELAAALGKLLGPAKVEIKVGAI
jgi:Transposase DDE domain group 1